MDNSTQLWDGNSESRPLRKPRSRVPNEYEKTTSNTELNENFSKLSCSGSDTVVKSKLSAEAKEWFPPNYIGTATSSNNIPQVQNFSVQNRLQAVRSVSSLTQESDEQLNDGGEGAKRDMERLQNIINTLTYEPGQFHTLLHVFMETFQPHFENITLITQMAEMLFSHAISVPNFRYTAARLCCIVEEQCPIFRSSLHLICNKQLDSVGSLQGLALFVAELYSQLHYENLYGTTLVEVLNKLLEIADDASIKCVCQTLKLTGYSLGLYDKSAVNQIFERLKNVRGSLSPSVGNFLNSVLKLRDEGWGMTQEGTQNSLETESSWASNNIAPMADDNTIFYNPEDGAELSTDEREFLAENFHSDFLDDGYFESDSEELCDPEPEMDEEIQAAFREFLKYSKQSKYS